MGDVNIVVGLSGVGKGTVMQEAMLLSDTDYQVINYGDRMLEIARQRGLVDNRDEMKEIETERYRDIQMEAAESIVEDSDDGKVIVETHAALKTPYGYIPGLPKWTVENLDPTKIIMIQADPEAIFRRSQQDDERDREHEKVEDVREYQEVAREMASAGAVMTGAYLETIENREGEAEKAAEELVETLRG